MYLGDYSLENLSSSKSEPPLLISYCFFGFFYSSSSSVSSSFSLTYKSLPKDTPLTNPTDTSIFTQFSIIHKVESSSISLPAILIAKLSLDLA